MENERILRSAECGKLCQEYLAPISLLRGCGYSYEDLKRPRVAIINTDSELNPGHIHLGELGEAVRKGIYDAGGMGFMIHCLSVCDGVAEGPYVLPSRDLLVNEIELQVEGNKMDAMVLIGTCDKCVPGLLMAAARVNIPAIVVTGGYMQTGTANGEPCDFVSIGMTISKHLEGTATREELDEVIEHACPGPGACGMMGTANSMDIISEIMGMSLPGNASTAAVAPELKELAYRAGRQVMELWKNNIRPRDIITEVSVTNAIKVCMAIGGSSNTIIHVPAIATEAELPMRCSEVYTEVSHEIPLLVGVRPNTGMHTVSEFAEAGGLGAIITRLGDRLDRTALTVTGRTLGENIEAEPERYVIRDESMIHTVEAPLEPCGGLVYCRGNLVPEGAVVKRSAVPEGMLCFRGPARVFDDSGVAIAALHNGEIQPGDAVIIRYHGVKAGPASAYRFTAALKGSKLKDCVAVITDGRTSGAASGALFQYASPEAAEGGPLCIVRDGDIISYDVDRKLLEIELSDEEIARRLSETVPKLTLQKGYLGIYQKCVSSVLKGAVLR